MHRAIKQVSSSNQMKYSMRNLFYTVQEVYAKVYPDEPFFQTYNSFTQDFLSKYTTEVDALADMVREPRGKWITRTEYSDMEGDNDGSLRIGQGNKAILIEKIGLWRTMVANHFHKRLDCCLIATEGFSTEETRNTLIRLEEQGVPIFVIHDFDINGILIRTSLHNETKRRKTSLQLDTHDLGLSWEDLQELDLVDNAEPCKHSKQDSAKLTTLYDQGEVTKEAYNFLTTSQVKLNALTPLDLLEFLTEKLNTLGFGKTLPTQGELDNISAEECKTAVGEVTDELTRKLYAEALTHLPSWVVEFEQRLDAIKDNLHDQAFGNAHTRIISECKTDVTVAAVKIRLNQQPTTYWSRAALSMIRVEAERVVENLQEETDVEDVAHDFYTNGEAKDSVKALGVYLKSELERWVNGKGYSWDTSKE